MLQIHENSRRALNNLQLQRNLSTTLTKVLHSRQQAVAEVENWEELREHARRVKLHSLGRLDHYLEELEENIESRGGKVIWAETGKEAADFIIGLTKKQGIRKLVKSKTMLGEEIGLNEKLEAAGISPIETDLGEFIVQLRREPPSHIVAPALHLSRQQVASLFQERLGVPSAAEVEELTAAARTFLRQEFLEARLGVTGVNFGVAESGTVVIVENEGNARLCTSIPETHVALMGIEKVIPKVADLAVFLKLLTRSATGQKITSYVNFISGPRRPGERDGPREFYLVLIDNGRSRILRDPHLRQTLSCIRCGACLNVCPVYRKIGGHSYQSTYQGPIGSILTPQLLSPAEASEHPFASTLCGACREVCPVKIEIPEILLRLRRDLREKDSRSLTETILFRLWSRAMSSDLRYGRATRGLRLLLRPFWKDGNLRVPLPVLNRWCLERDLPSVPGRSFREIFASNREKP